MRNLKIWCAIVAFSFYVGACKEEKKVATDQPNVRATVDVKQIHGEFIKEIFKVVLGRDLRNADEFQRYMNILDQGGHYEGIYNGVIYSTEYRELEKGVCPVNGLKLFTELLVQIKLDQKYDPLTLPRPDKPYVPDPAPTPYTMPTPSPAEREQLKEKIENENISSSCYRLKRVLGEEALRTIDLKKEYKEKFATWYGRFTSMLNKKNVDFGLKERNIPDEYYHYKWALEADEDRLKWETLNRLHQLLNSQIKQSL